IGRAIPNMQVYLLDEDLQPVPAGSPGEIYVGGVGVTRGYRGRPDLTKERFIPNPFVPKGHPEDVLYKTGDLGRYIPDGLATGMIIEHLGRIDHQVKIRGFRIELGEIERVLRGIPSVQEAVVVAREEPNGEKRLVAYVVTETEAGRADGQNTEQVTQLRAHLAAHLPDYMLPAAFVALDTLPLTPNGKVDRLALPAPDTARPQLKTALVMPQSETEQVLATIWQEALQLEQVGTHDNFFELGGHSLLLTQVYQKLVPIFGEKLSIVSLFQYPTIHTLAGYLSHLMKATQDEQLSQQSPIIQRTRRQTHTQNATEQKTRRRLAQAKRKRLESGE
ncbi:MAG: AMP-binding protein, partial [Caldilineaceae bacterium]|nr:AMP-binding protein [Caldilineaceae bacterium]